MERIAGAPASPQKALAAGQAALIERDYQTSGARISHLAVASRHQVGAQFAKVRQTVSGFFTQSVAGVQALAAAKQAQIASHAAGVLEAIQGGIASAVANVTARADQIRGQVESFVEGAVDSMQRRVHEMTQQIADVIDAVPLPDVPGIAQVRGVATHLLQQAVGLVSSASGYVLGFVRSALDAGMELLATLIQSAAQLASLALARAASAIQNVLQLIFQSLSALAQLVTSVMNGALQLIVLPILERLEALIGSRVSAAEQRALGFLRSNREEHLEALATSVAPQAAGSAGANEQAHTGSTQDAASALQNIGASALQSSRELVQAFEAHTSATILAIIKAVEGAAGQIVVGIASRIAQLAQRVATAITEVVQSMAQLVQGVADFMQMLLGAMAEALSDILEAVRSMAQNPIDQLIQFAQRALGRMRDFVGRFVSNLISTGTGVAASVRDAIGDFSPTALLVGPLPLRGPITKPPPPVLEVIIRLVVGGIVAAVSALMVLLFGAELAAIIMANPLLALVILVVLVLLVALLLLLLYLLFRLIKPPKPTPGKRIVSVTPSTIELGVGGRDIIATARISPGVPAVPPITWTINPPVPAGVSIVGSGPRVTVRAGHPPHGTTTGGTSITVRAAQTAVPADFADSPPVMLVQTVSATYAANPSLVGVPSLIPGTPPPNTAEPNRDGIGGNTALVNAVTAPATRTVTVSLRRSLGASVAGTTITLGSNTGDIGLRIADAATGARLDETKPATVGPAALMADLTVNAVPLRVSALAGAGPLGPYGVLNTITFAPSDALHPPLTRIVGELITNGGDDFNIPPPNFGFNPVFDLRLAVPANSWNDQLVTPPAVNNVADGRPAIDVNRFVGPGVPHLPRRLIYRQRFEYSAWQGAGTIISRAIDDGRHIRSLIGSPGSFQFSTEHRFPRATAPVRIEPYVGPPLIILSNVVATPTAAGSTALAADGVATAHLGVTSSVAARTVNWSVLSGDIAITAGNPAVLPATATLKAGVRTGNFGVRAADTIFPNRQVDGRVSVVAVALRGMTATPNPVPAGAASATVTLNADPGGRTINWSVDAAAAAAGVTVTPNVTGPGAPAMTVTVSRPAGFTGSVTVIAADSVLAARTNNLRVRFK